MAKKDNSTLLLKASLRSNLLKLVDNPIVMETHGGYGGIWHKCYMDIGQGVVMEKDAEKCKTLAVQRPAWAVYECDCVVALAGGLGSHLPINFLDIDPYGEPWPVIDAFFLSNRPFPGTLAIVVNDGGMQFVKRGHGWKMTSIADRIADMGNSYAYNQYLDICKEALQEKARHRGYTMTRWAGYKATPDVAHYAAILKSS